MAYKDITPPAGGKISIKDGVLTVPDNPVIPFIRGDGTGRDIWKASEKVMDAAVEKAYGGKKKISWFEVFAGEASKTKFDNWLPDDTVEAFNEYLVGIKGPLTTPVGGAYPFAQRRFAPDKLDLYVCLRPVQGASGVPSPVKHPEKVDMVIFRENTEDIYAGIDFWGRQSKRSALGDSWNFWSIYPKEFKKDPFRRHGTRHGRRRHQARLAPRHGICLLQAAIQYAIDQKKKSVTIVHKGNIMKYTEGAFRDWAYDLAKKEFGGVEIDGGPWCKLPNSIIIKDAIADITLQQVLTRAEDFSVIATLNLNGDYLSDALAAQVGGIGIAPGGNINYITGHAIFEATHGTAPKYADQDVVNPGSVILSGEMMFRYLGWGEAADLLIKGLNGAIASKKVTYDFARQMEGATKIKCSEFGDNIIAHM